MQTIDTNSNPEELAWDMFEKTGNISYYLLSKKLSVEE